MLRGFYQYFALHHCERRLSWIRHEILRQWKHALQRRGQRRRLSWERLGNCSWLVAICAQHASNGLTRCAPLRMSSGEPGAGNLHAGFCLGRRVQEASRLGEGTGAKVSATVRLRTDYRFKARLYHPERLVGPEMAPHQGKRRCYRRALRTIRSSVSSMSMSQSLSGRPT
jgi:hypothetical protein